MGPVHRQFLVISVVIGGTLFALIRFFAYLETAGFFGDSDLFSGEENHLYEIVNISFAAFILNFGFCGPRFFEAHLKLEKELHQSRLQTLNGQINPHSMFNILNHIHVLLQKDPQAADDLLLKYADILRYQLYNAYESGVTVEKDTDYLKQYIEVEKTRWKNKITITQDWMIENEDAGIPPLLFICFP